MIVSLGNRECVTGRMDRYGWVELGVGGEMKGSFGNDQVSIPIFLLNLGQRMKTTLLFYSVLVYCKIINAFQSYFVNIRMFHDMQVESVNISNTLKWKYKF